MSKRRDKRYTARKRFLTYLKSREMKAALPMPQYPHTPYETFLGWVMEAFIKNPEEVLLPPLMLSSNWYAAADVLQLGPADTRFTPLRIPYGYPHEWLTSIRHHEGGD